MIILTKKDMIDILVVSPAWDGSKDKKLLLKNYSYQEIKDLYNELTEAEQDYFESLYN